MKPKVLITGSSGFLGSHVVEAFVAIGYDVIEFDIVPSKNSLISKKFVGDLLDKELLEDAIQGCDIVFHFGGMADIAECNQRPNEAVAANVLGTINLLSVCANNRVEKFFFASSIYVYSENGGIYRATKQCCEVLIDEFSTQYGFEYTNLRFGSLFGPGATLDNSIYKMIHEALYKGKITRDGDGEEVREYIYVKDAAEICVELVEKKIKEKNIILKGNQSYKISKITEMINGIFGGKLQVEFTGNTHNGHYKITPYSFRPNSAIQYNSHRFRDFGQSLLELIHEVNSSRES